MVHRYTIAGFDPEAAECRFRQSDEAAVEYAVVDDVQRRDDRMRVDRHQNPTARSKPLRLAHRAVTAHVQHRLLVRIDAHVDGGKFGAFAHRFCCLVPEPHYAAASAIQTMMRVNAPSVNGSRAAT